MFVHIEAQELIGVQLTGSRIVQRGMPCLVCSSDAAALTQQDLRQRVFETVLAISHGT